MNWMDYWKHCYQCGVSDGNDNRSGKSVYDTYDYVVGGSLPDWTARDSPPAYPALVYSL